MFMTVYTCIVLAAYFAVFWIYDIKSKSCFEFST